MDFSLGVSGQKGSEEQAGNNIWGANWRLTVVWRANQSHTSQARARCCILFWMPSSSKRHRCLSTSSSPLSTARYPAFEEQSTSLRCKLVVAGDHVLHYMLLLNDMVRSNLCFLCWNQYTSMNLNRSCYFQTGTLQCTDSLKRINFHA
jgi:hypothetical protein